MFGAQGANGGGRIVFAIHVWLVNTGIGKRRADESFARGSDQHRIPGGVEPLQCHHQREVMFDARFGESKTRIDDDL